MWGQLISFRISCEDRQACIASVRHAAWSHVKIAHLKAEALLRFLIVSNAKSELIQSDLKVFSLYNKTYSVNKTSFRVKKKKVLANQES